MTRTIIAGCVLLGAAALGLAAGCTVGKATTVPGYDSRWKDLSREDRLAVMYEVVEPQMRAAFQGFDAERFADFDCATCHGAGAEDESYAMPNPALPHLREKLIYREHRKAHPELVEFMWKGVEQPTAKMLGKTAGHGGEFSCWSCHIVDDRHE